MDESITKEPFNLKTDVVSSHQQPRVSVILPNYNHSVFLDVRIRSILDQTFTDFELIILDDCSTDNSRVVIERYRSNPKVSHIIFNEMNSGSPFKQWEKGIKISKGEFIWIAESDDTADLNFLQKTVACALDSKAQIVYTDSYQIDHNGQIIDRWSTVMQAFGRHNIWDRGFSKYGSELLSTLHPITNTIPNASCALTRKSIIKPEYLAQIRTFKYAGDWLFWGLCYVDAKVSYIHEPLNFFRTHANTTRSAKGFRKQDLYEYYHCIGAFRSYLSQDLQQVFDQNLEHIFYKWHFNSLEYFLRNFSWKRYSMAKNVDAKVDLRILKFFFHMPGRIRRKLFRKV